MLSVVSLVGRPNVGKSSLFNRLTRSRDALVDDQPGVTRDRQYGTCRIGESRFLVVDTGGLETSDSGFSEAIQDQVTRVLEESDLVFFLVDALEGIGHQDREIAQQLRISGVPTMVVVNKAEGRQAQSVSAEFQELGLGDPRVISAKRGDGVETLVGAATQYVTPEDESENAAEDRPVVALAGRPNVGKSTLTNRLAREQRVIVSKIPGTTRDSIRISLDIDGFSFDLIDTAGVRRKSRVSEAIEKYSVVKTLQAVESSQVVLLLLDGSEGVQTQDATIAGMVDDLGRSIVLLVNKWDGLETHQKTKLRKEIDQKLAFLPNPEILPISALHGSRINEVVPAIRRAFGSAMADISTSELNRTLENAVTQTPTPSHNGRAIRLKYAHQGGKCPPTIVIHGNQTASLPESYRRYLARYFARAYGLVGTRVRILTRGSKNPYGGKTKVGKSPRHRG